MSFLSHRMDLIKPSATLAVSAKAKELKAAGKKIIDLSTGEPDFDTPQHIKNAAIEAIEMGKTKYTVVGGTGELKAAIAAKLKRDVNLEYKPSEIVVSSGAKQGLFNALMATLNHGDEVIVPAPYWVSYPEMVALFGGVNVIVPCAEEQGFKMSPEQLEKAITPKTKWVILNTPSNPTGAVYTGEELEALADVLRKHDHVHIMLDEIYEHLVYDDFVFASFLKIAPDLKERILLVNGVSKGYAMTGWRIGYAAGAEKLIKAMSTLQSQSTSNACSISQAASFSGLTGEHDFLKKMKQTYMQRRDGFLERLSKTDKLSAKKAKGAFYLFVNCQKMLGDQLKNDQDVCTYFLEEVGVAAVPGSAFGMPGYFRISFALETEALFEAADLLVKAANA